MPAAASSLPKTRIRASRIGVPNGLWSEPTLTPSSHRRCAGTCTTSAAGSARYTQPDPMGLAADVNLFAYAGGNPIGWADPLGLVRRKDKCRLSCPELLAAIEELAQEIETRWEIGNRLKGQGTFPRGTTLDGHIQQYEEKQETLREFIQEYEDRCGNKVPERIWELATRPQPYPKQDQSARQRSPEIPNWIPQWWLDFGDYTKRLEQAIRPPVIPLVAPGGLTVPVPVLVP